MSTSPLIDAQLEDLEEQRRERRAEMRARLGLPLSYEDLEVLLGVPIQTLYNWRSKGLLRPLPSKTGSPRFALEDAAAILGAQRWEEGDPDNVGHDQPQKDGREQMADTLQVQRPPDGAAEDLPADDRRHARRSARSSRRGPSSVPAPGGEARGGSSLELVRGIVSDRESNT